MRRRDVLVLGSNDATGDPRPRITRRLRHQVVGTGMNDDGAPEDAVRPIERHDIIHPAVLCHSARRSFEVAQIAHVSLARGRVWGAVWAPVRVVVAARRGTFVLALADLVEMKAVQTGLQSIYYSADLHATVDLRERHTS